MTILGQLPTKVGPAITCPSVYDDGRDRKARWAEQLSFHPLELRVHSFRPPPRGPPLALGTTTLTGRQNSHVCVTGQSFLLVDDRRINDARCISVHSNDLFCGVPCGPFSDTVSRVITNSADINFCHSLCSLKVYKLGLSRRWPQHRLHLSQVFPKAKSSRCQTDLPAPAPLAGKVPFVDSVQTARRSRPTATDSIFRQAII